jgi:hypothetical protein
MKLTKWNIYLNNELIDSVFFTKKTTAEEIKRSLVQHDGYDPLIEVKEEK